MKILVCIKQVPDMESKFRLDGNNTWYETADLAWRMNEYDEYAVEQAVKLKEQVEEAEITVLSIGSDKVKEVMKKALAMGCDRGIHIADDNASAKEPFEIAGAIAEYAKGKEYEIIFTGMQSQDRGSGQVGVLVAEMLALPAITTIVDFAYDAGRIEVKRELEGGMKARVAVVTPAVVTCQLGLNTPRYPTLPNIMKAKKKELISCQMEELFKIKPRQSTARMYFPKKMGGGIVLEGEPADLVDQLIQILKDRTSILA